MNEIGQLIDQVDAIVKGAVASVPLDVLHADGVALLTALAGLALVLQGFRVWLGDAGMNKLFAQLAWSLVCIGALFWLVNDGLTGFFADGIDASFVAIANKLMPGAGDGSSMKAALTILWETMQHVGQLYDKLFEGVGRLDVLTVFFKNLFSILIILFAQFMLLLAMIAFMTISTVSMVLVKIALIIAPVLIPWAMFNISAFLFVGWLRFFVTASLYKVVGAAVLFFASKILGGFSAIAMTGSTGFLATTLAALSIASLTISISALVVMIPRISQQLVSAPAGEIGFRLGLK